MVRRVLILEDNPDFVNILRVILEQTSSEVIEAYSGTEGLGKALAEKPDLIIVDLGLPDMDGIEVTQRLKRDPSTTHIPIIGYSVWGREFKHRAMEAGMIHYFVKSDSPLAIKNAVENVCPAGRPGGELRPWV